MKIEQVGIYNSINLKEKFSTSKLIDKGHSKSLAAGEAITFEEPFLIPIKKTRRTSAGDCEESARHETVMMSELLNCLGDIDDFNKYLKEVHFPGPAGGSFVFNRFAIQIELIDGTYVQEEMRFLESGPFRTPLTNNERLEIEAMKINRKVNTTK